MLLGQVKEARERQKVAVGGQGWGCSTAVVPSRGRSAEADCGEIAALHLRGGDTMQNWGVVHRMVGVERPLRKSRRRYWVGCPVRGPGPRATLRGACVRCTETFSYEPGCQMSRATMTSLMKI